MGVNIHLLMSQWPSDIEYAERGQGPALPFVPGSFGTGAGWKPVIDKLGEGYRFVTISLLGYGTTAERRPLGNVTMAQQTEVLDAVFERIDTQVHVAGAIPCSPRSTTVSSPKLGAPETGTDWRFASSAGSSAGLRTSNQPASGWSPQTGTTSRSRARVAAT